MHRPRAVLLWALAMSTLGPGVMPAHAAPAGAERVRAFTPGPTSPRAEAVVRHDAAVVPQSLRRSSNAVLLAIAVAAAVVALVAGLTLVRQRSDAGGPTPSDEPTQPAAAVVGAPANLS